MQRRNFRHKIFWIDGWLEQASETPRKKEKQKTFPSTLVLMAFLCGGGKCKCGLGSRVGTRVMRNVTKNFHFAAF